MQSAILSLLDAHKYASLQSKNHIAQTSVFQIVTCYLGLKTKT